MSALTQPHSIESDPEVYRLLQQLHPTADTPPVGLWDGALTSTVKGLPRGILEGKATLEQAVGGAMDAARSAGASINFAPNDADYEAGLGDAGFDRFQQAEGQYQEDTLATQAKAIDTRKQAAEYRPDPLSTGAAGQIGNEFTALIPRTVAGAVAAGPGGGALAAGLPAGQAETARLEGEGVDADTAQQVGAVQGLTTAAGVVLPAAGIVKGPLLDAGLAAAANVGLGVAQRGSSAKVLRDAGYIEQAAQFEALDTTAMAVDAGLSLLFSGAHHLTAKPDADALLTARNADRFTRGDGLLPVDSRSGAAADQAKTAAIDALHEGRAVNVPPEVAEAGFIADPFHQPPTLPPEVHQAAREAMPTPDLYEATAERIVALESGGKADAKNPRSSATGAGQFIDSTWLEMIRRHRPDLAAYKSNAEILALRLDPELSGAMVAQLARDNGEAFTRAGIAPTPELLYAAHHFGIDKALEFARASGDTPMRDILSAGKIAANPYLANVTKAQLLGNWARRGLNATPEAASVPRMAVEAPARPLTLAELDAEAANPLTGPTRRRAVEMLAATERAKVAETAEPASLGGRLVDFVSNLARPRTEPDAPARSEPGAVPAQPKRPTLPDDPRVNAALDVAMATPDHPILTGYDADGLPQFRPLAEAMDEIHTDYALATREADAYTAGANCYLRRGGA